MKIIYRHGDLMKTPAKYVVQGCNAQGVMGSGVAKILRDHDESIFTEYRRVYEKQDNFLRQGQTIWVKSFPFSVINAITQENYGREPGVVYADYEAIADAFISIDRAFERMSFQEVAMPLIGAGLAQGKWSIISAIIEEAANHFQPVVYLLDGIIPDEVDGEVVTV